MGALLSKGEGKEPQERVADGTPPFSSDDSPAFAQLGFEHIVKRIAAAACRPVQPIFCVEDDFVGFRRPVLVSAHGGAEQHVDTFQVGIRDANRVAEDDDRVRLFILEIVGPDFPGGH